MSPIVLLALAARSPPRAPPRASWASHSHASPRSSAVQEARLCCSAVRRRCVRVRRARVPAASAQHEPAPPTGFVEASVVKVHKSLETGPVIFLRLMGGEGTRGLLLPVFVGETESAALTAHLRKTPPGRPLTHDLMANAFGALNVHVTSVQVTHLQNNTYYAKMVLNGDVSVDARPSDAINLAVRCGAPIFVAESVARSNGVRQAVPSSGADDPMPASPSRLLDKTLELRMRLAIAVQRGRADHAESLRDDIASLLADQAPIAVSAAALMLEVELAVKEERWRDAARARKLLAEMDVANTPGGLVEP